MWNSQSHFVSKSNNTSMSTSRSRSRSNPPPPRLTVTPTPPSPETGGNVSPTIRRWQHTFQLIRRDRYLVDQFLRRLHTPAPGAGPGGGNFFARYFLLRFEDTIRQVIRQELHQVLTCFNLPPRLLPDQNIPPQYQVHFINQVKNPTFTTDLVRDHKEDPIQVAIYDSYTRQVISPDCSLSSKKVTMTVLDAKFLENKGASWSRSDFKKGLLRNREGKGPILSGRDLTVHLENGVGTFGNIVFNDNSSWSNRWFRLGAEFEGGEGFINGERVQEGVSEPFVVKDRRVKASQKPNQLDLKHNVQKLKKIGKDRASRLEKNKIKTVEDFLDCYYRDPSELQKILGIKSESDKEWEIMVKHAMECADIFHAKKEALKSTQPQQFFVQTSVSNVPLLQSGLPFVGSGSSEPNPCEHNLINPGLTQLDIPSDSVLTEVVFPNADSTPSNIGQFHSISMMQSRIVPMAEYGALESTSLPQQALGYPLERNASPLPNGEPLVLTPSSSEANSHDNNVNYQDGMSSCYEQLSPICDVSSIVSNEQISAASGEHPVETQSTLFHESNHMTIQTGNILNLNSMQQTYADGSPQLSSDMVPMEYLYADAESNYIWQAPLISSVCAGPFSPHRKAKRKALLKWITWPAVARKRARITQAAIQTTVPAM